MEYCKRSRISSFECAILTQSALYLTCECALIGTRTVFHHGAALSAVRSGAPCGVRPVGFSAGSPLGFLEDT